MARELECPVCNADVPLAGDERPGDDISCSYCRAPLKLGRGDDPEEMELEEEL